MLACRRRSPAWPQLFQPAPSAPDFIECTAPSNLMQKTAILYDASQAILSTFDLDEVLRQILSIVRDYFRVNRAAVLLINPETKEFSLRSQIGGFQTDLSMATGNGIIGQAARRKRPLYVADVSINPHYVANFADTNSELAIPLMVRDQVVGV